MKTLLATLAFALTLAFGSAPALAQDARVPLINPSRLKATGPGYPRKGPCGTGDGYNCGSNPPTKKLTTDNCGWMFSTSQARNADASVSKRGVRFILPTVAELTAKGYTGGGLTDAAGYANRETQCTIAFVMGAPGPDNYLEIAIDGVQGTDKLTPFAQGAYDIFNGSLIWPYRTPGTLVLSWNGFSWLVLSASPAIAEHMNQGQLAANGQGRLFYVTSDPTWWTAGTMVGSLAYCPHNGRGTVANASGGSQLTVIPPLCTFRSAGSGTAAEYIAYRNLPSGIINGLEQGAAYAAGTAPNGDTYPAGNYIVLNTPITAYTTGNMIEVHNVPSNLGSNAEGRWIGKVIDSTHVELHERVMAFDENSKAPIGAPSAFVAGDSLKSATGYPGWNSAALTATSLTGGHFTNLSTGVESVNAANADTVVGLASRVSGVGYQDSATNRRVASWYNPVDKRCQSGLTTSRAVTAATYTEPNNELRCSFVNLNRVSTVAAAWGDQVSGIRYTLIATVSNSVAGQGCRVGVAFDVPTTPESDTTVLATSVTAGAKTTITVTGIKTGLTDNVHYGTASMQTTGSGTCTIEADAKLAIDLRQ